MLNYINNQNLDIEQLLKRVVVFLEDGEFDRAKEYCERVLDGDAYNAVAYLGILLAELKVKTVKGLLQLEKPFKDNKNYEKVIRYGDEKLAEVLMDYNLKVTYKFLVSLKDKAKKEKDFIFLIEEFAKIYDYSDSAQLYEECKKHISPKGNNYKKGKPNVATKITVFALVAVVIAFVVFAVIKFVVPETKYNNAVELYEDGQCTKALGMFMELGDYKKSKNYIYNYNRNNSFSAGAGQTVGLKVDGTVVAVGHNHFGQCDVSDWKNMMIPKIK